MHFFTGISEGTAGMEDTSLYLKLEKPKGLCSVHVCVYLNYMYVCHHYMYMYEMCQKNI